MKISNLIGAAVVCVTLCARLAFGANGYTGSPAPQIITATLTPGTVASLITNNVTVVGVQLITTSGTGTASFFDSPTLAAPYNGTNAVVPSYVGTAGYATNYVTSYVGYNGYTNWYTNAGYWTYSVTNAAATNALTPKGILPLVGGTVTSGNNQMSFQQGITVRATTNCTVIVSYIPNR